jgi:hypothetical protein
LYPALVTAFATSSADAAAVATTRTVLAERFATTASTPGTAAHARSTLATHLPQDISTMNSSERATEGGADSEAGGDSVAAATGARRRDGTARGARRRSADARGAVARGDAARSIVEVDVMAAPRRSVLEKPLEERF